MTRRYFVNLDTGGHMIMDAKMGSGKNKQLLGIVGGVGYEEVSHERYRRLIQKRRIGERAIRNKEEADA